jgi:hypothetical protein
VPESINLITGALETVSITHNVDNSQFAYWFASFERYIFGRITPLPVSMGSPVHPANTSHGPFTPSLESEPAPPSIASSPESLMAAATPSSHDEAFHTQTLPDHPSKLLTLPPMNSQPTVQPSALPSVRPEAHSTTSLKPNYNKATTLYTSLIGSSNLGATPGPRSGYQGYARGPGVPPPSVQVSVASSVSG